MIQFEDQIMYKAERIAEFILCLAELYGDTITNLKLQKLLYYAQAWFLVNNNNERLFSDDIVAWQYGPVVEAVYNRFQIFGRTPIEIECNLDFDDISAEVQQYLREFCQEFFRFSATELVGMTHNELPWNEAVKNGYGSVINTDTMFRFYTDLLNQDEQ